MFSFKIVLIILSNFLTINAYKVLNLKNPTTKYGFVYPNRAEPNSNVTYVLEGVDVLIYLAKVPENYAKCEVTTPDAEITYSLEANVGDESSKVEFWTPDSNNTGCGARIKKVTVLDSGRWRLKAVSEEEDHLYQSFINLKVIKNYDRPDGDFIIKEGPFDEFNMTKYASYCEITDPVLSGDHKIFDKCQIDLKNINKLLAGKWKAKVGVLGKIDEIILQPKVDVIGEQFDVGFIKTATGKLNLYCNLKNSILTNFTFCRFIKNGTDIGFRLSEGLSNGNYSYFGRELKDGDCGITIENPTVEDYGLWKCSLGIHRLVNKGVEYEVKEAVISPKNTKKRSIRAAENSIVKKQEILAGLENPLVLFHETDFQIKYCIVKHPNGTQYAINGQFSSGYWKTNGDINTGQCGMTIFRASHNESGLWKMQIGHHETHFMDEIVHLPVRVGDKALIAVTRTITVEEGSQLIIKCKSVAQKQSILEYCRFTLPDGSGFQIDEHVTEDEAIDGLYWYNGTSVAEGDCQVTIKTVNSDHYGEWSCSGKIQGSRNLEEYDYINIESGQLSIAAISGIAAGGAILLIGSVGGIIYYRKKKRQQPQRRQTYLSSSSVSSRSDDVAVFERDAPLVSAEARQPEDAQVIEEIEMTNMSRAQSRTSAASRPSTSAHSRPSTSAQSRESRPSTSAQSRESRPSSSAQSRVSESAQSRISAQSLASVASAQSRRSTNSQARPTSSASTHQQVQERTEL